MASTGTPYRLVPAHFYLWRWIWVGSIHALSWVGSNGSMMSWFQRLRAYIFSKSETEDFAFYTKKTKYVVCAT